jgi:phospholipid/cholesterol/gamma-HCH transport system substrate-binding protein
MTPGRERGSKRVPSWLIGTVVIAVLAVASVLAFGSLLGWDTKFPWHSAYEVKAVFGSAQNIRPSSAVRIAGIEVGKVTEVEHLSAADQDDLSAATDGAAGVDADRPPGEDAAVVTMELDDSARPVHSDATFKLRPRLFLEGNYFVDLSPGSPNADEVEDGHTFGLDRTSYSVQLDQVLSTLQGDVRSDLQTFLNQLGNALVKHGGGEGLRELYATSAPSFKYTSQVSEALLGTQPGDLSGVIRGVDRVVEGLGRDERSLQDLVTNFRIFSGSFAAQDEALGRAIEVLPSVLDASRPAFANLNASFPAVRAFAREALPGVRSTPATLDAAIPFVDQVRALVARRELRGLVADLRPTIPKLARLSDRSIGFLHQARAIASCFNEVVLPWSQDTVKPVDPTGQYTHDPAGRVFEETAYGLEGIASESRSGDANGQYIRVQAGGGTNTIQLPNDLPAVGGGLQDAIGLTQFPLLGAMPRIEDSAKTPFRPDVPCETQEPPNLEAGRGQPSGTTAPVPPIDIGDLLDDLTPDQIERKAKNVGLPERQAKALAKYGRKR